MDSFLYGFPTALIVAVLFVFIVLGIELGYRLGRRTQTRLIEPVKTQINAIQASMLALLALVLGFTFSLSLQRFDDRAKAVVDEANAIGTTYLRTYLLPESVRADKPELLYSRRLKTRPPGAQRSHLPRNPPQAQALDSAVPGVARAA